LVRCCVEEGSMAWRRRVRVARQRRGGFVAKRRRAGSAQS
jgi:hypothetical protein